MEQPPTVDPRLRSALRVAFLASLLGSCGAAGGLGQLEAPAAGVSDEGPLDTTASQGREEARAANRVLWELVNQDPLRRVMGASNALLSGLMIVAAVMLFRRRPSAIWWLTQAALANSLFILARALAAALRIHALAPRLTSTMAAYLAATTPDPQANAELTGAAFANAMLVMMLAMPVLWALVDVALHLGVAWRARRADVRGWLDEGPPRSHGA